MNVHPSHNTGLLTVAEFIEWPGDGNGTRYELVDGVLRPVAPGSDAHNTIVMQLGRLIGNYLERALPTHRVVAAPGIQPHLRADWNYRIPDLGVTATPNALGYLMTPDPILLIEILSPGNKQDTYDNVRAYATLPSVLEIVMIESTRIGAEVLRRDETGDWPPNPEAIAHGALLELKSIGASFPLHHVYAGTHLA